MRNPVLVEGQWAVSQVEIEEDAGCRLKMDVDLAKVWVGPDGRKNYAHDWRSWILSMRDGRVSQISGRESLDFKFPPDVAGVVQERLDSLAQKVFEHPFSRGKGKLDLEKIFDFVNYPNCPQMNRLQNFFRGRIREKISRDSENPYRDLCSLLAVRPFKKLRSLFDENPLAVPVFVVLKRWGFSDVNVVTKFLRNSAVIERYFSGIQLDKGTIVCDVGRDAGFDFFRFREVDGNLVTLLEWWCAESIRKFGEKVSMNRLLDAMGGDSVDFMDGAKMFYSRRAAIPQALTERILRECFTSEVHAELLRIFPRYGGRTQQANRKIVYTPFEQLLAEKDEKTGLEFALPEDTDEIYKWGSRFHNCVGHCYSSSAADKRCTIVAMRQADNYLVCLELRGRNIHQMKAPCNARPGPNARMAVEEWAKRHELEFHCR